MRRSRATFRWTYRLDKFSSYFKIDECLDFRFIHEIRTKGYDVIGINVLRRKLMRFLRKEDNSVLLY